MPGLPVTQTILPQAPGGLPDSSTTPCCPATGEESTFSQVLTLHISERFNAKLALGDLAEELQADPGVTGGDANLQAGAQPAVDVSQVAELLAQMAGGLQLQRSPSQPSPDQPHERSNGGTSLEAAPVEAKPQAGEISVLQGDRAARFAADGKFLPVIENGHEPRHEPGQLQLGDKAAPDFAQVLAGHGAENGHSNRTDALVMVQGRHEAVEIRQSQHSQPLAVEPRVGTPQWDGAVGQKVVWLIGQNQQSADLHLNPPHLGPLDVRLSLAADGQTSVQFVSQHAVVREALESAVPRLRDMLADNGITLGSVQVGAESFSRQQQAAGEQGRRHEGRGTDGMEEIVTVLDRPYERNSLGMLDLFA